MNSRNEMFSVHNLFQCRFGTTANLFPFTTGNSNGRFKYNGIRPIQNGNARASFENCSCGNKKIYLSGEL